MCHKGFSLILFCLATTALTISEVILYSGNFSLNILSPVFGTTTFWGVFLQGFISGILGIIAAIIVLYLLHNEELKDLVKTINTKFWRAKIIAPSQEEL